tara:strand:+ start:2263 stop:3012 length:750 start_codon:yes stop_codon:yes gene_type:complete
MWADSAARHRADGNPTQGEYHEGRAERFRTMYMKRTKIDPATGAKVKNKAAKAERMKNVQCGYCGAMGHTRRICEAVKADYQVYLVETRQVREDAVKRVREMGIGAGSMLAFKEHSYNAEGEWGLNLQLNYIMRYEWGRVDSHRRTLDVRYVGNKDIYRMNDPFHTSTITFTSLVERLQNQDGVPEPSLAGSVEPPDGWIDSAPSIKCAFPTKGSQYEKKRAYEYVWPCDSRKQVIRDLGLQEHYRNME